MTSTSQEAVKELIKEHGLIYKEEKSGIILTPEQHYVSRMDLCEKMSLGCVRRLFQSSKYFHKLYFDALAERHRSGFPPSLGDGSPDPKFLVSKSGVGYYCVVVSKDVTQTVGPRDETIFICFHDVWEMCVPGDEKFMMILLKLRLAYKK